MVSLVGFFKVGLQCQRLSRYDTHCMFSLGVSPCRLLYWFSRPLSARAIHYRSTPCSYRGYLATKHIFLIVLLTKSFCTFTVHFFVFSQYTMWRSFYNTLFSVSVLHMTHRNTKISFRAIISSRRASSVALHLAIL